MSITYRGETFSGVNKPKATPGHKSKSHAVLAEVNGRRKLVRFGQKGVKGAGANPKSAKDKARKRSFVARHGAQNGAKMKSDKFSPLYWSKRTKW